jgi:threonylcarbamoyladenosine tRNA methylthiotransferase MtaB
MPPHRVLEHARFIGEMGFAEVVLTGVHLGMYGKDLSPVASLEDLVAGLLESCPDPRFRLSSVEPPEITPGLIDLAASHPRVCRHFHIPLQSGDDRILKRMARPYDTALLESLVASVRNASPDVCIGMDVMVGFPGEDEESFRRTREFIERLRPAYLHVFPFSPRPGTPAASFTPRVDSTAAAARAAELRTLSARLRAEFYTGIAGRILDVVLEENSGDGGDTILARSDNYVPVRVPRSDLDGSEGIFHVRVERCAGGEAWGRRI